MEYYYVTCGRVYRLPTRTLEVDEAIDRIVTGEDRLRAVLIFLGIPLSKRSDHMRWPTAT